MGGLSFWMGIGMAIERSWVGIPTQLFTVDGGQYGQVSIPTTEGIKVKQKVYVGSNLINPQQLEVKRVIDSTTILLGPIGPEMKTYSDLRVLTTAANAYLRIDEQERPKIVPDAFWRAVYDEEPTVALRTTLVDSLGNRFTKSNPIPVQLSDGSINIGTVNANLEVQLTDKESAPGEDDYDIVRIGNGINQLAVNSDGSINANVVMGVPVPTITRNVFNEVTLVPSGSETLIATFTVPMGKTGKIEKITASGENIGKYTVKLNGSSIDVRRTYWTGGFNVMFDYASDASGYKLNPGDVVSIHIFHESDDPATFDARLQIVEIG